MVFVEFFCNVIWDFVLCWLFILIGLEIKLFCFKYFGFLLNRFVIKLCGRNGKWIGKYFGIEFFLNNFYLGWINYLECMGFKYDIFVFVLINRMVDLNFNVFELFLISVGIFFFYSEGVDIFFILLLILFFIMILVFVIIIFCICGFVFICKKFYRNCFVVFLVYDFLEFVIRMGCIV